MEQTLAPLTHSAGAAEAFSSGAVLTPRSVAFPAAGGLAVDRRYLRNAALAFAALLAAIALAYRPGVFDRPVTAFLNQFAHRSPALDTAFWSLDACFIFSGFALMALVWFCWFDHTDQDGRARLLVASLIAFPVGCFSRILQHKLATHPRPFYDPLLHFRAPYLMGDKPLNTWNSFPSDHVTVFACLLTAICIARPRLSKFVIPYFIVVESARTYMGAHYPSDLLGGAAFGIMMVWLAQGPRIVAFGKRILRWQETSPAWFHMGAFLLTSLTATLFLEPRTVGSYFVHVLRHMPIRQ